MTKMSEDDEIITVKKRRPSNFKTPNQLSAKKYKQGKSIGQYLTAKSSSSSNDADPSRNQKILPLRNYPWSDTTTESDESEQEEETSSQEIEGYSSKMKKPGQKTKSRTTSYKSLDANSSIFKPDTSALNDISDAHFWASRLWICFRCHEPFDNWQKWKVHQPTCNKRVQDGIKRWTCGGCLAQLTTEDYYIHQSEAYRCDCGQLLLKCTPKTEIYINGHIVPPRHNCPLAAASTSAETSKTTSVTSSSEATQTEISYD